MILVVWSIWNCLSLTAGIHWFVCISSVSPRSIKSSAVLQQTFCQEYHSELKPSASLDFFMVVFLGVIFRPPLPDLCFGGSKDLKMLGCSQCQVLHTFTGWVSCIFSSVLYLTAWVPCVFIYSGALQSMNVLTLLGNNVGKWHFGFVGTIKRSVFTARFFNTVTLTSHCLVNQLCQQL